MKGRANDHISLQLQVKWSIIFPKLSLAADSCQQYFSWSNSLFIFHIRKKPKPTNWELINISNLASLAMPSKHSKKFFRKPQLPTSDLPSPFSDTLQAQRFPPSILCYQKDVSVLRNFESSILDSFRGNTKPFKQY